MPITDSQFRFLMIEVIFLTLWGIFNALYIGSQIKNPGLLGFTQLLSASWAVFTSSELMFLNAILGAIGIAGAAIIGASILSG